MFKILQREKQTMQVYEPDHRHHKGPKLLYDGAMVVRNSSQASFLADLCGPIDIIYMIDI